MIPNWFIPRKDLKINLDEWAPGNPLWITGSTGDGKSTAAADIAKVYEAEVITMDMVLCRIAWPEDRFNELRSRDTHFAHVLRMNTASHAALRYIDLHPDLPRGAKNPVTGEYDHTIIDPIMTDFCYWLMDVLATDPRYRDRLYIVEGCDITLVDPEVMSEKPLIIIGGCRLRTLIRAARRRAEGKCISVWQAFMIGIKRYSYVYKPIDDRKEKFRRGVEYMLR